MPKHDHAHLSQPSKHGSANREAQESPDDLLTIHEVANRLRVDDTTVRRWINNGALDAVTLPHLGDRRSYRVKRKTLDTLMSTTTLNRR